MLIGAIEGLNDGLAYGLASTGHSRRLHHLDLAHWCLNQLACSARASRKRCEMTRHATRNRPATAVGRSVYRSAIGLFVLYHWIVPNSPSEFRNFIQGWFSNANTNEMVIYIIMALGLNIVVGYAGLLDLGFVAFWAIGGYVAGWLMSSFLNTFKVNIFGNPAPGLEMGIHVTFWWVLLAGGAFCAIWGIIIGAPTLRLKSDYLALVTLGFGEIIPQVFVNGENINGFNLSNGNKGITPLDPIQFFGFRNLGPFDLDYKFVIYAIICAGMVLVSLRLRSGRLGRAWLAIREDELAASMMGVPLMRTKLFRLCGGRVLRWTWWRGVRDTHQWHLRRALQLLDLHHFAGDGRARRHGQCLGRDGGRVGALVDQWHWSAAIRQQREWCPGYGYQLPVVQLPHLWHAADFDDDVPSRRVHPRSPHQTRDA